MLMNEAFDNNKKRIGIGFVGKFSQILQHYINLTAYVEYLYTIKI